MPEAANFHGTTILSVRRDGVVAMGGDGQVTIGSTVMKSNARKVRRLYQNKVLAGFAGGTADAFTLFERFEGKLEQYGNLTRGAIEAGEGLAHRSIPATARSALVCRRCAKLVHHLRQRRCDRARAAIDGDRLRRPPTRRSAARALLEDSKLSAREIVERRSTSPRISASIPIAISPSRN